METTRHSPPDWQRRGQQAALSSASPSPGPLPSRRGSLLLWCACAEGGVGLESISSSSCQPALSPSVCDSQAGLPQYSISASLQHSPCTRPSPVSLDLLSCVCYPDGWPDLPSPLPRRPVVLGLDCASLLLVLSTCMHMVPRVGSVSRSSEDKQLWTLHLRAHFWNIVLVSDSPACFQKMAARATWGLETVP